MKAPLFHLRFLAPLGLLASVLLGGASFQTGRSTTPKEKAKAPDRTAQVKTYASTIRPLVAKYCLGCHSTKAKKGSLDLERFATLEQVRKDLRPWQQMIEQLEAGEMPPRDEPQPSADQRKQVIAWIRALLDGEALARAGDPGHVPLRRLSNAEYDHTIRDLTGVDLRPTREFPADGAGGEGFTNAAESLSDISPTLLAKYLDAAKAVADHALLLPDGFRFSPTKTRRDWTDESVARLRAFYASFASGEGRLSVQPYLLATIRHRETLTTKTKTIEQVARAEKLNPKYLGILWRTLTDRTPSYPLDPIRAAWRAAAEKDVAALVAEVAAWQAASWKVVRIGSYVHSVDRKYHLSTTRQVPNDPLPGETQVVRLAVKPTPGQSEVVLHLLARDLGGAGRGQHVVWHRPRFEGGGKTLLLKDYTRFGPSHEVDFPAVFASTPKYLAATVEAANDRKSSVVDLAKKHGLDAAFLKRWIEVLAVEPLEKGTADPDAVGTVVPLVALERLDEKAAKVGNWPAINAWRRKGTDLPSLITNASDTTQRIPGTMRGHAVTVHPTPSEFVAVTWKSPVAGRIKIAARIAHAHDACGNGIAWWLEHRRSSRAAVLSEGVIDRGGKASAPALTLKMEKGDLVVLAVDARNRDHSCDLTEITLTLTEADKPGRVWDLAADVADTVLAGNPHADGHGNREVWSFVRGPTREIGKTRRGILPPGSILARWREAAADRARSKEIGKLADEARSLLSGPRPTRPGAPDGALYDNLVSVESPLLRGLDLSRSGKPRTGFGLAKERFGKHPATGMPADEASLVVPSNTVTEIRLPAGLFAGREFVVEGKGDGTGDRVVQFQVTTAPPGPAVRWDGKSPVVAAAKGEGYRRLLEGYEAFRRCFPLFVCFPAIVPTDEVVTLKMFHREDEPLARLFLDAQEKQRLDRLWNEHRFISQQPVAENRYLPLFIGFVTQDQPREMLAFFEGQRGAFAERARAFEKERESAIPGQLEELLAFAGRAFRRPASEKQRTDLLALYRTLRGKGVAHEEAFRGVLARILVSPAFLFRVEKAPPGAEPGPVDDWELASRLSYFLTSSAPDDELRRLAAAGKLRDPKVLVEQAGRLLKDDRARALAIEFGTQWIHVRGFEELKEKNEKLFPTFDVHLRKAISEESIRFFLDLFQADRPVTHVLDADATFLDERLARHYGIPGVTGPQWRRVEGVRKYGRGGVLGLASVQARQSGASRTSPILRGNWVVETLLGEKLPRPPANVPQLPEEEGKDRLTMRQLVEKHARVPACAVCHKRIDPFGFALESYDPIGRRREKDLGGLPVDAKAKLEDGTAFEGIDGLRTYLVTKKKNVIVRLFCRKLLGYALGRAVTLSDQSLVDEMVAQLDRNDGRVSAAVRTIVTSKPFRMIRGSGFVE